MNTYTHLKSDDAREEMEKLSMIRKATEEVTRSDEPEEAPDDLAWKMA